MKKNIPLTEKERRIILGLYKVLDCLPSDMIWKFEDELQRMINDYFYRKQILIGCFPQCLTEYSSPLMTFGWYQTVCGFSFWAECHILYILHRDYCKEL